MRLLTILLLLAACSSTATRPLRYDGFDGYAREVTTTVPEAQAWFDQGIQLMYGFNHAEAIRSFQAATESDPNCAMAWWGISYANGLDINDPSISEIEAKLAYDAAQEALALVDSAEPVERALIEAVAARYEWPNPDDRTRLDEAYAERMRDAFLAFPRDADVGALYAESLMNLQAWDYWAKDGSPRKRITEIVAALEHVLALRPDHPGANHFYIHAVEASSTPERAEAAADRLRDMVPGSGHLVHMPSHIYVRIGRYEDAARANVLAIEADKRYFAKAPPPAIYSMYFVHNIHFLGYASMMEGRREAAMGAARQIATELPEGFAKNYLGMADGFLAMPYQVMVRFGEWEAILEEPQPSEERKLSRAMLSAARGLAFAAMGRTEEARLEQLSFERAASEVPEEWTMGLNPAADVLAIARRMMEGEVLYREGRLDEAYAALRDAVAKEDALTYDEPPGWMMPTRHALGALLMGGGRFAEAEAVYRDDLNKQPNNGWGLIGLERALTSLGRHAEVETVRVAREAAWKRADVAPTSSCYCEPGVSKP
jgi:tetratricopeptide (TPR) repeat protein